MNLSNSNLFNLTVSLSEIKYTRKINGKLYTIIVSYSNSDDCIAKINKLSKLNNDNFKFFSLQLNSTVN